MKSIRILYVTILFALISYLMSGFASANTQFVTINKIKLGSIETLVLSKNAAVQANNEGASYASLNDAISLLNSQKQKLLAEKELLSSKAGLNKPLKESDPPSDLYIIYSSLSKMMDSAISSLNGQIDSISSQQNNLWKTNAEKNASNSKIVCNAQQLYFNYCSTRLQREDAYNKLSTLEKKLLFTTAKLGMGLISETEYLQSGFMVRDARELLKTLDTTIYLIRGQLNIMLAQDFDTELSIDDPDIIADSNIHSINYEEGLKQGMGQCVDLFQASGYMRDDEVRKFKQSYDKSYHKVQEKVNELNLENEKLAYEQRMLGIDSFKLEKGLISRYTYDNRKYSFDSEKIKTRKA